MSEQPETPWTFTARPSSSPAPPGTKAAPPHVTCSPAAGTSAPSSVTTPPPAAAALAAAGAELVLGDLDDRASCDTAVRGAYGVYSVQSANDNEAAQGK